MTTKQKVIKIILDQHDSMESSNMKNLIPKFLSQNINAKNAKKVILELKEEGLVTANFGIFTKSQNIYVLPTDKLLQ